MCPRAPHRGHDAVAGVEGTDAVALGTLNDEEETYVDAHKR